MTDKLQKKIRELEDTDAGEALERHLEHHSEAERDEALLILGGLIAVDRLKDAIEAETINALIRFQKEGRYRALGFDQFADFLNKSPLSPMTKSTFYRQKDLLEKEGEPTYNFLTLQLAFPAAKRKLFGRGDIQVDGENVIVRDGEEEIVIHRGSPDLVFQALTAIADKKLDLEHQLAKQAEDLETAAAKNEKLTDEIKSVKAARAVEAGLDPHTLAIANLSTAYAVLIAEVEKLAPVERQQFRDKTFEMIAVQMQRLASAHESEDWTAIAQSSPKASGAVDPYIEGLLDRAAAMDDEDAANDRELEQLI